MVIIFLTLQDCKVLIVLLTKYSILVIYIKKNQHQIKSCVCRKEGSLLLASFCAYVPERGGRWVGYILCYREGWRWLVRGGDCYQSYWCRPCSSVKSGGGVSWCRVCDVSPAPIHRTHIHTLPSILIAATNDARGKELIHYDEPYYDVITSDLKL